MTDQLLGTISFSKAYFILLHFKGRVTERRTKTDIEIFHLLAHPPNDWSWANLKPEARSLLWVSHVGLGHPLLPYQAISKELIEVEEPGPKPATIWGAGSADRVHHANMPIFNTIILKDRVHPIHQHIKKAIALGTEGKMEKGERCSKQATAICLYPQHLFTRKAREKQGCASSPWPAGLSLAASGPAFPL